MNYLAKLKAKAEADLAKQKAIMDAAAAEDRDMTDAESAEFDALQSSMEKTLAQIARVEKSAGAALTVAKVNTEALEDVTGNIKAVTDPGNSPANIRVDFAKKTLTGAEIVGICAWGAAKNKHYPTKTAIQHIREAGFDQIADASLATRKAMLETKAFDTITVGTGDNTVTTPLSTDFIEFLRNESIFMSGGPTPVDLSFGKLDIPGGNVGVAGTYSAEGSDSPYVQASTRKVSMSAKHMKAITAIGNYNLEVSPLAVASIVGDDLAMGLTLSMDAAGLRGDGTGSNPAGVLTLAHASHKIASAALVVAPTVAQIDNDVRRMLTLIRASNVPKRRRRWLMSNRVFTYLQFMRDGNGNLVYPGLSAVNPTWFDNYPVSISEQIPSTLGGTTNESEIYLVDFGHVLMGIARALAITSSTEASYKNAGGTLVSAFSQDETVLRAVASHDFGMRHTRAAVVLQQVRWGA